MRTQLEYSQVSIWDGLHHPNIARLLDVYAGEPVRLVYEPSGETLHAVSSQTPFAASALPCMLLQLCQALEHLHGRDIIHCDINTTSVLCDKMGHVRLIDFGVARIDLTGFRVEIPLVEVVQSGLLIGTLQYRAPEILLGFTKFTSQVDLWSAGCVLAELAAQAAVFTSRTIEDMLDAVFEMLGGPEIDTALEICCWPGWRESYTDFPSQPRWTARFRALSDDGKVLLRSLMTVAPTRRAI
jgi:serine/threonine protein kinase